MSDARTRAVTFAAVAGGCLLAMPVSLLFSHGSVTPWSAFAFALGFLAVFCAGTTLLYRFRDAAYAAVIAGTVCAVAAVLVGGTHLGIAFARLGAAALIAIGAIWLAFRDWRYPVYGEIGWGALAIGMEVVIGSAAGLKGWQVPLGLLIPTFFAAAFASRTVTVWHEPEADPAEARTWIERIPVAFVAYVVAVTAIAAAALRGGIVQWLGSIVLPVASVVLTVVLLILEAILSPIVWLISHFHVDAEAWEQRLRSVGGGGDTTTRFQPHGAVAGTISRVVGFVLISIVVWAVFRTLRRIRPPEVPPPSRPAPVRVMSAALPAEAPATPGRRRTLPEDQVRRWYAEALLALERRHLHKDPSLTPAEFAREVGATRPDLRDDLDPLTRAYEDVRYGSLALGGVTLRELRAHHRALIATLKRSPEQDQGEPEAT